MLPRSTLSAEIPARVAQRNSRVRSSSRDRNATPLGQSLIRLHRPHFRRLRRLSWLQNGEGMRARSRVSEVGPRMKEGKKEVSEVGKLFTDNLSLGLQYLYLSNRLSFSDVDDQHTRIHTGMLNAAWRMNNGVVHPFIGAGIGFGVTTVEPAGIEEDDTATDVAGQIFFGFDYDIFANVFDNSILDNVYVGVNGRWFVTEAEVFGFDEAFHQFALMGNIGYKF
jgi:hypothetical protein